MRHDRLISSTPFRLALIFALISIGAFLATGLVVYELVSWQLQRRQDQTIQQIYAVIADSYGDTDLTDLLDTVSTNVRATPHHQRIFLVTDTNGTVLGGNIPGRVFADGWSDVKADTIGLKGDTVYRTYSGAVDGHQLTVGLSHEEVDSLNEIIVGSFAWSSLVVLIVALAGGAWVASRAQQRLDAVRDTMVRVSHGDLAARIPLSGRGDDIDRLSHDINGALDRLATSVEGLRQVSADIAHDLKTPLNRLRIIVEDAIENHSAGKTIVDDLSLAADEADQINQTFDALLRIAQIESGARKARFGPVDINRILTSLADIYADVAEDARQVFATHLSDEGSAVVSGDRELLTQMYANLIENAIRHCPAGTRIRLETEIAGERLVTSVEDNGPGIPTEDRERVFRRLYRLEKSRTSPGTGLGLSLGEGSGGPSRCRSPRRWCESRTALCRHVSTHHPSGDGDMIARGTPPLVRRYLLRGRRDSDLESAEMGNVTSGRLGGTGAFPADLLMHGFQALSERSPARPRAKRSRHYHALFLSDLHLGANGCRADGLLDFLQAHTADTIYLVGDVFDVWRPLGSAWKDTHHAIVNDLLERALEGVRIVYTPGNHDAFFRHYFGAITVADHVFHTTRDGTRYLVIHGDGVDPFERRTPILAKLGAHVESTVRSVQMGVNLARGWFDRPEWTGAETGLERVKEMLRKRDSHEAQLVDLARAHGADGVICGHYHRPALHDDHGLVYANCGDWMGSCTALAETASGKLALIDWSTMTSSITQMRVVRPVAVEG